MVQVRYPSATSALCFRDVIDALPALGVPTEIEKPEAEAVRVVVFHYGTAPFERGVAVVDTVL